MFQIPNSNWETKCLLLSQNKHVCKCNNNNRTKLILVTGCRIMGGPPPPKKITLCNSVFFSAHHYQMWNQVSLKWVYQQYCGEIAKDPSALPLLGKPWTTGNEPGSVLKVRYYLGGMAHWGLSLILFWNFPGKNILEFKLRKMSIF